MSSSVALEHRIQAKYEIRNTKHIQNTYHESTLKTLDKSGKIYLIYTTLESGEKTKIDTVWERVPFCILVKLKFHGSSLPRSILVASSRGRR